MKYKKKSLIVDAFKYDGDLVDKNGNWYVPDWAKEAFLSGRLFYDSVDSNSPPSELFVSDTGKHVKVGDYIVRSGLSNIYPVNEIIFKMAYEEVKDE